MLYMHKCFKPMDALSMMLCTVSGISNCFESLLPSHWISPDMSIMHVCEELVATLAITDLIIYSFSSLRSCH